MISARLTFSSLTQVSFQQRLCTKLMLGISSVTVFTFAFAFSLILWPQATHLQAFPCLYLLFIHVPPLLFLLVIFNLILD
ncbi:hypothetical protein AQUCO_00201393v1 [Aquilegia coerulea]|uniref:Uncharacterized protein n=1 Tax=Aquilegia coerulea TaxID=218851 RepID=A0A2G5F7Z0_AQUCA|nr:hypothetical protein AQUCO_00201393v1 [Aquilegia coerulea]